MEQPADCCDEATQTRSVLLTQWFDSLWLCRQGAAEESTHGHADLSQDRAGLSAKAGRLGACHRLRGDQQRFRDGRGRGAIVALFAMWRAVLRQPLPFAQS